VTTRKGIEIRYEVEIQYFDKDKDGHLSPAERSEVERVEALNKLNLEDFLALPDHERDAAESLFAAQALDAGYEALERRRARIARQRAASR
jgi:hypothetical protein